jgi:Arc/MetJ-type ribon-helix-helix transcriptional regulator
MAADSHDPPVFGTWRKQLPIAADVTSSVRYGVRKVLDERDEAKTLIPALMVCAGANCSAAGHQREEPRAFDDRPRAAAI